MLSWFLFIAQVAMEGDILANGTDIKNTRTSNCWFRLLLVKCKAKCRSISNLSETAAAMNFNQILTGEWQPHRIWSKTSCIKSPIVEECFLKCKSFKSVLKIRENSKRFVLQNRKKGNSTHHQLLNDPPSAMRLWVSVLYKFNDLEFIIHTLFKKGRILLFTIMHGSLA